MITSKQTTEKTDNEKGESKIAKEREKILENKAREQSISHSSLEWLLGQVNPG